jgi:hypothetical protein
MNVINQIKQWFRVHPREIETVSPPGPSVKGRTIEEQGQTGRIADTASDEAAAGESDEAGRRVDAVT